MWYILKTYDRFFNIKNMKKKKIKKLIQDAVNEIHCLEKEACGVKETFQDISEIDPESSEKFEHFVRKIIHHHEDCFINIGPSEIGITIQLKTSSIDISIVRDSGFHILENSSGNYGPLSRYHDTKLYGRIEQEIRKIKSERDSSRLESTLEELYNKTGLLRGENLDRILDEKN
jgi:hypothetical protein